MSQGAFTFADEGYHAPNEHTPPIARASDHQTSKIAAEGMKQSLGKCQAGFLEALRRIGKPSTASEVAQVAHRIDPSKSQESYRKRAKELVDEAKVLAEHPVRKCEVTGKLATTYWIKT